MNYSVKEIFTISNFVSMLRMLLVLPTSYYLSKISESDTYRIIVITLFLGAYITDLLDGFLARKFNQITEFGKIIDPLADKIFVSVIVFQLFWMDQIPSYYFWIIILRDLIIFVGGIFVTRIIGKVLPSNLLGKITVASIAFFLLAIVGGAQNYGWLYYSLLILSITLSFASVIGYTIRAYENIKWVKDNLYNS
jgi:CDP-diacylglycerol--glycerol-3-phosphate 3-phosphatidyltransferase